MRSEQRKSKLTLYIILSLALIIAISSFIYAAKSKHQLTEVTSQLEYAASNNEEASNERISELEAEIESLSQQLDEAESNQPQTETKAATESKKAEPEKEVTKQETTPTQPEQPKELSKEEARQIVIDFAQVRNNDNLKTAYDHDEGNDYIFQVYEVVDDGGGSGHTATFGWYGVNKLTGEVYNTMD